MRMILGMAAAVTLAGCTTVFTGAAKVTNGPAGCRASCDAWGMDLAGMVKMGEYSDGCICQVRPAAPAAPAPGPASVPSAAATDTRRAVGGPQAVAGVWVQMQAAAAAAAQQTAANRQTGQGGYGPGSRTGSPGFH